MHRVLLLALLLAGGVAAGAADAAHRLRVGAFASELKADNDYDIAGGIHPWKAAGQEGKLRSVAVVLEKPGYRKVALVALDILMIRRAFLDPVVRELERKTGIPASHILINCTHTHSAPSTITIHGYREDERFIREVQRGIIESVTEANARLEESVFHFAEGEEWTVGANSRLLLSDLTIYWIGPFDDALRPTGPFDPELPVLAFRKPNGILQALLFNHSTHTIGSRKPGVRSPSFYGLAAQELEEKHGGVFGFLEGASGSTHNLHLSTDEAATRIKQAVEKTLASARPRPVQPLAAIKRPFEFRVRTFQEADEEEKVLSYCRKRHPGGAEPIAAVFRNMRRELAPHQGEKRTTWIQAVRIGDVAFVAVPAEFFTRLGVQIKEQSPFEHTYIAELANDYVGYLPDLEGHRLGGYQTWTGFHSFAEPGTGERMVDACVKLLHELAGTRPAGKP